MSFRNRGIIKKGYSEKGFKDEFRPVTPTNQIVIPKQKKSDIKESAVDYVLRMAKKDRSYEKFKIVKEKKPKIIDYIKEVKSFLNKFLMNFNHKRKIVDEGLKSKSKEEIAIENAKRMYAERANIPKFKSKRRPQKA